MTDGVFVTDAWFQSSVHEGSSGGSSGGTDSEAATPTSPSHLSASSNSASTWTNWPEPPAAGAKADGTKGQPAASGGAPPGGDRPHTISTAYERSHTRPPITAQTFEPPDHPRLLEQKSSAASASPYAVPCIVPPSNAQQQQQQQQQAQYAALSRDKMADIKPPHPGPKMRARHVVPPMVPDFNMSHSDQSKKTHGNVTYYSRRFTGTLCCLRGVAFNGNVALLNSICLRLTSL